jgi:hypothetical protein
LKEFNCKIDPAVTNRGLISNNNWHTDHESQCARKMTGNDPDLLSDTIPEFFSRVLKINEKQMITVIFPD